MATLYIFGDEAGTMPVRDQDKPFVAAVVGIVDSIPGGLEINGRRNQLIDYLLTLGAFPFVACVCPKEGYGRALQMKTEKMNLMARITRHITGANRRYLSEKGMQLRNFVWSHCMQQAVGQTIASAMFQGSIEAVVVALHKKTMATAHRTLFTDLILNKSSHMRSALTGLRSIAPTRIGEYQSRLKFTAEDVKLYWSDEDIPFDPSSGLDLAHHLAGTFHRDLQVRQSEGIAKLLSDSGFRHWYMDLTDILMAPLHRESIEGWERSTGLSEPNL